MSVPTAAQAAAGKCQPARSPRLGLAGAPATQAAGTSASHRQPLPWIESRL